jgi:hypothetical protein
MYIYMPIEKLVIDRTRLKDIDTLCEWEGMFDAEGFGGKPSCRFVVRVPLYNNIFVTAKSVYRIAQGPLNMKAYRLGRKRLGGANGFINESMLHGQYPGRMVYIIGQKMEDSDEYDKCYINNDSN